jgi:hypothetical protein
VSLGPGQPQPRPPLPLIALGQTGGRCLVSHVCTPQATLFGSQSTFSYLVQKRPDTTSSPCTFIYYSTITSFVRVRGDSTKLVPTQPAPIRVQPVSSDSKISPSTSAPCGVALHRPSAYPPARHYNTYAIRTWQFKLPSVPRLPLLFTRLKLSPSSWAFCLRACSPAGQPHS